MSDAKDKTALQIEREEFEKQPILEEYLNTLKVWERRYCRLMRSLIDDFGEELVLDTVEKVWWDQAYQVGLTWREKFEQDPTAAMHAKAHSWHDDPMWARICCCEVPVLTDTRWELNSVRCYREVFKEMGEPKIAMSWCMTDFAAVRGWSPKIVMRSPHHLLRGDAFCQQIRFISDDPSLQWDYSKETSEKIGWRSIKRLEE